MTSGFKETRLKLLEIQLPDVTTGSQLCKPIINSKRSTIIQRDLSRTLLPASIIISFKALIIYPSIIASLTSLPQTPASGEARDIYSGQNLARIKMMTCVLTIKCFPREIHNPQSPSWRLHHSLPSRSNSPKILPLRNLPQFEVSNLELEAPNCSLLRSLSAVTPFHPPNVHNM